VNAGLPGDTTVDGQLSSLRMAGIGMTRLNI
jgi:hypothetical protein